MINLNKQKIVEILTYCKPHLNQMWASSIVGIVLDCDFKDAKSKLNSYMDSLGNKKEVSEKSNNNYKGVF